MSKKRTKFWVRLCRPRFETAILELKAVDEEGAEQLALQRFVDEALTEGDWRLQPFDPESYTAHVERVLSERELQDDENEAEDNSLFDFLGELKAIEQDEYTRYLLLHADVGGGSGKVLWQPWFPADSPELLEHDLAIDWVADLKEILEEGIQNFEDIFTPKPDITVPHSRRAILVPGLTDEPSADVGEERPDPRQYHSELPEILARPLTKKEHDAVLACLAAVDKVLCTPQTVAMRAELAAALTAHACSAAHESAIATGFPQQAEQRYATFERLIQMRSRELFAQERA